MRVPDWETQCFHAFAEWEKGRLLVIRHDVGVNLRSAIGISVKPRIALRAHHTDTRL